MYAIVKTGGKQYKVAPGDKINIEKLNVEPGDKVELEAICVVDGDKVEADPEKAAKTKVVATVLEQFNVVRDGERVDDVPHRGGLDDEDLHGRSPPIASSRTIVAGSRPDSARRERRLPSSTPG